MVLFQGIVFGMEPGCKGGSGRSEQPKKNMATHRAVWGQGEIRTGQDAAKKEPEKKQAVSKESEGGDSLLERTENRRKVGDDADRR